jgi:hypothetical protein
MLHTSSFSSIDYATRLFEKSYQALLPEKITRRFNIFRDVLTGKDYAG